MRSDRELQLSFMTSAGPFAPALEYMVDAAQRSILFWDVMRQRGNQYREHLEQTAPHVLDYEVELLVDGRKLDRPVNYALVRVVPPGAPRRVAPAAPAAVRVPPGPAPAGGVDLPDGPGAVRAPRALAPGRPPALASPLPRTRTAARPHSPRRSPARALPLARGPKTCQSHAPARGRVENVLHRHAIDLRP